MRKPSKDIPQAIDRLTNLLIMLNASVLLNCIDRVPDVRKVIESTQDNVIDIEGEP